MNYNEKINDLLFDNKITVKKLATDLNVSRTTVYRWINGESQLSLNNLVLLADYFKCSTDFILDTTQNFFTVMPKQLPKFSIRLREVMKEKQISTYKLRQISKYESIYFQKWDKGIEPLASTLLELSKILDCTIDYLIGRE